MKMQVYSGRFVDPLNVDVHQISIDDIARSLSMQCRFNGHVRSFYSVAEHCCHVSDALVSWGRQVQLAGLLHDAGEAYYGDIIMPVRRSLPDLDKRLEEIDLAIYDKFGVSPHREQVHEVDMRMLATEAEHLLKQPAEGWHRCPHWFGDGKWPNSLQRHTPQCWDSDKAEAEYLRRFCTLTIKSSGEATLFGDGHGRE